MQWSIKAVVDLSEACDQLEHNKLIITLSILLVVRAQCFDNVGNEYYNLREQTVSNNCIYCVTVVYHRAL
jgi:hypothetical protein